MHMLLEHVIFTSLYISERKFNNTEHVNSVFRKFHFWRRYELVGSNHKKMDPWTLDISERDIECADCL